MISEFSESDEKLDVYLCKADLDLLKGLSKPDAEDSVENNSEDGFASAIAGMLMVWMEMIVCSKVIRM